MPHAEEIGNERMALGLFDDAFAGIDQNNGEVGRGGACDHVARILDMAGRVSDDEFPAWRGEVAVGHIDGDTLLALGAQAVCEERQIYDGIPTASGAFLDGHELVLENALGIIKQASDESGFAVINRTGGGEAKKIHFGFFKSKRVG